MKEKKRAMTKRSSVRPRDICSPTPTDLMTDGLTNQDLTQLRHLQVENTREARLALYGARAQLG